MLDKIDNKNKEIIMLGEFNTNSLNKSEFNILYKITSQYPLHQLIDTIARLVSGTFLDHVNTSRDEIYSKRKFPNTTSLTVQLDNKTNEETETTKLLGVTFDSNLKSDYHLNTIYNTINSRLYLLEKIGDCLPYSFLVQYYFSLPHLLYCCIMWGDVRNELINDPLLQQRRAAKLKKISCTLYRIFSQA